MTTPFSFAPAPPTAAPKAFAWRGRDGILLRLSVGSFVGSLCALAAPLYPWTESYPRLFVDLASHFVWPYLGLALLIAVTGKRASRWLARATVPVCAYVLTAAAFAEAPRVASTPAAQRHLKVLSANVYFDNKTPDRLLALVVDRQPDVIFLQEVSPTWARALVGLPGYPYRKVVERGDSFGIALLSKHPLENITVLDEAQYDIPSIGATMRWEGQQVELRAVHPLPPMSRGAYADRNTLLYQNAKALSASARPAIMAGDFNATPWSAGWSVVQEAGLMRATTLRPTYPANLLVPAMVPIDQIAVTRHWAVIESHRGPNIGSDHFPVEAELTLNP